MCYYPFFRSDLPDDDYTTLVPQPKPMNINNRKIPTIIEDQENNSMLVKTEITHQKDDNQRKTTIAGVSRRHSTIDFDSFKHTRSVPSSPALNHISRRRSTRSKMSLIAFENDAKSISSEYASLSTNGPSNSLSSGSLEVRLKFDAKNSKMWVFVIKATLEMAQRLSKQTLVQVHLTVLPNKRIRFRTRVKPIDNAMFAEEFFCKVSPETIQSEGIRFRLYTYERFKREKLLAEATVMFAMVNLDEDMCKIVPLERAYPSQDSDLGTRSHSRQNSLVQSRDETRHSVLPELEIGLAYDKNQSILTLEIGKGINFGITLHGRAPGQDFTASILLELFHFILLDTYVQITLRNLNGEEIVSNRTIIKQAQHHPIFAERYPYNLSENFLNQMTLIISVIHKKSPNLPDSDFGCISFGHDASDDAQISHWDSMLHAQGETITRWHALLEK